jgi:ferredoxin-NADP reductase
LKLVSITQQTPDANTVRFILPKGRTLNSRPGQFLTFSFLFDGQNWSDRIPFVRRRQGRVTSRSRQNG